MSVINKASLLILIASSYSFSRSLGKGTQYVWNPISANCEVQTLNGSFIKITNNSDCKVCSVSSSKEAKIGSLLTVVKDIENKIASPKALIDKYAKADKDYKHHKTLYIGSTVTPTSVEYDFGYEKLTPGKCIYLAIPEHLRDKPLLFVNLGHTQSYSDNTGYDSAKEWDKNPGLTTVQLNQVDNTGNPNWRYWNGPSSGDFGAKFAEPSHMELEGLYEWYKYGHKDIKTHTNNKDPLYVDGARLCSIGKDPVTLGSLIVKMAPKKSDEYKEFNISKSNSMGNSLTAEGRNYGSRSDAVFLGGYGSKKLSDGLKVENGNLEIPLKAGSNLNSFELSVGDARSDGSSGGAKISAYVLKSDGQRVSILKRENVPPKGVLIGTPQVDKVSIEKGDKLIVKSHYDEAFVMGLRLGYIK